MIGGGLDGGSTEFSDSVVSAGSWLTFVFATMADATASYIHRITSIGF